jgi:hypothetical protein
VLINRRAGGLQKVDVTASHGLLDVDLRLAVGEAPALVEPGCHLESVADGSTQLTARRPGEDGDAVFHRTPLSCRDHRMQLAGQLRVPRSMVEGCCDLQTGRVIAHFVVSARQATVGEPVHAAGGKEFATSWKSSA